MVANMFEDESNGIRKVMAERNKMMAGQLLTMREYVNMLDVDK